MTNRAGLPVAVVGHLVLSALAASLFVWRFGHAPHGIAAHVLLVAQLDVALLSLVGVLLVFRPQVGVRRAGVLFMLLLAIVSTLQVYLYGLNFISNSSWGRNITGHLVSVFAPTVWSGREAFPLGPAGISVVALGTLLLMVGLATRIRPWIHPRGGRFGAVTIAAALAGVCYVTVSHAVIRRDSVFWRQELVASFFRPEGYAFEPTARREAVAERDAALRAAYPRRVAAARRKNVVLIMVDSLRADRMQVYGYERATTPFLSKLVGEGRMKRVDNAFSTCSESFCGITSALASREFRHISARTFQLQDVLRDEGYQTWFLLSGNHRAWNGLPAFYHASEDDMMFDGSQTQRYTMDDDRVVLEGLERVPAASPDQPAFFHIHLMSPHYLGVQLPESHVFTHPGDRVSPGLEPYTILDQLNKPDRYDDKVLQADGIIRQLFEALSAKHYLDDAIVVVTGDHGEGLGERHWAHGWHLYNEDIRIPMLWYDAPRASYQDLAFAAHVDIAPTILDRLGLPIPESWEGQSLLKPARERFTHHQTYFFPNRFAVLYRAERSLFKFIATPEYGQEELYDVINDRGEVRNLVGEKPGLASLLRDKVRAYRLDQP
jgi:glucan phosphoethanolaminetransferase (alkaline phosphatase superfamily)